MRGIEWCWGYERLGVCGVGGWGFEESELS